MDKYFQINAEGCNIRCKLYCDDPAGVRRLILFGHGFGGHKDNRAAERFARRVLEKNKGAAIVTFNWPCHGDDVRKTLTLPDCDAYLRLVLAHLEERFQPEETDAYATSFGGYLFLKYISEHPNPFRKIALRSPAVNMFEVLSAVIMDGDQAARIARGKPALVGFDRKVEITRAFLEELRQADITGRDYLAFADDVLILQGTRDEIVPTQAVRAFAEANLIDYIPVPDADHRFLDPKKMDFAIGEILRFFALK